MRKSVIFRIFSVDTFKLLFFATSILCVSPLIPQSCYSYLKLFHIYGIVVLCVDFFTEKRILRNEGRLFLALFIISYCMTLLTNPELINTSDISNFCYLLLTLGIVYSYGKDSNRREWICTNIMCVLITIANFVGIVMFYVKYSVVIPKEQFIGCYPYENRLAGLFGNPNVLGMVSLIGVSLCTTLLSTCKKKNLRILFIAACVINIVSLLLSNSRTQIYSFAFGCGVFTFLQALKNKKNIGSFFMALFVAIVMVGAVIGGCKLAQQGLAVLDVRFDYYQQNIIRTENEDYSNRDIDHSDERIWREDSGFNGRVELWRYGIEIFKAKPIFGNGLDNHTNALKKLGYDSLPVRGNLHNVYLEILACCGLAGFGCFILYLLVELLKLKDFFTYNEGNTWTHGAVLTAIILAFMLDGVADSTLIASFYPTEIAFWYFASQLVHLIEQEAKQTDRCQSEILYRLADKLS